MTCHRANEIRILDLVIDIGDECPPGHVTAGDSVDRHLLFLAGYGIQDSHLSGYAAFLDYAQS